MYASLKIPSPKPSMKIGMDKRVAYILCKVNYTKTTTRIYEYLRCEHHNFDNKDQRLCFDDNGFLLAKVEGLSIASSSHLDLIHDFALEA
jgi:hypothetical protein